MAAITPSFDPSAEKQPAVIDQNGTFIVVEDVDCIRVIVEWTSKSFGMVCDLDLKVYFYDERARFIEKLDVSGNHRSKDGSCALHGDVDVANLANQYYEVVKINLDKVDPATTAILFYIDGGPRHFQFVSTISLCCISAPVDRNGSLLLPTHEAASMLPLFVMNCRSKKDYHGVAMAAVYKDGWGSTQKPRWISRAILEPVFVSTEKGKEDECTHIVINAVPSFAKFRPRLFGNVRDLCQALSSRALPKLKNKFMKAAGAKLALQEFTEVVFKQLYDTHPKIVEESESAYTVAMIEEMFYQIDDSNDGSADWDEFTTFCVQVGLTQVGGSTNAGGGSAGTSLDEYIIEYGEDVLMRDRILSPHRYISTMRHSVENKRFLVIPEDSDHIILMDEDFRLISQLYPYKVEAVTGVGVVGGGATTKKQLDAINAVQGPGTGSRTVVYDVAYLAGKEMYAFTASDHAITICKEHTSMGGQKVKYALHNRIYHTLLHLKLCWSARFKLLCSVASDRIIYGWDIDGQMPIFQISRHSDLVTDFIAIDNLEMFATCSMDHRIVLWSAQTRRVRGVLLGHKMGVRCLSHYDNTLLSAGFESDARTWDLVSKDAVAILRGHRFPVAAARLMCDRAQSEKEYQAITVDESGEFRLWNIYVKERATDPTLVPTIQIFEMQSPEVPLNMFRFIAIPNNPRLSTGYYSDMVACSTKMMKFLPEKNAKEFLPPTACVFHDTSSLIVTAVGKTVLKYDICTGAFASSYPDLTGADVTALCPDGGKGHRLMVGCGKGELLMINFMTGLIVDRMNVHSKEITSVIVHYGRRNIIYTSSLDGKIGITEEAAGQLHLLNAIEGTFEKLSVARLKHVPTLKVLFALSTGPKWCILNDATLKKIVTIEECSVVNAIEIIGASRDEEDLDYLERVKDTMPAPMLARRSKEHLVTFAVALANGINIYTYDTMDMIGIQPFRLLHDRMIYVTDMAMLRAPDDNCVNYSTTRKLGSGQLGPQLIATTDDGFIVTWDLKTLRKRSEEKFRRKFNPVNNDRSSSPPVGGELLLSQPSSHSQADSGNLGNENWGEDDDKEDDDADISSSETSSSCGSPARKRVGLSLSDPSLTTTKPSSLRSGRDSSPELPPLVILHEGGKGEDIKKGSGEDIKKGSTLQIVTDDTSAVSASFVVAPLSPKKSPTSLSLIRSTSPKTFMSMLATARQRQHTTKTAAHRSRDGSVASAITFGPPVGKRGIIEYMSTREWLGHSDSANILVPLHDHGCIVTVSLDGFHRVWNIDRDCLGEFPLPNLIEKMKHPSSRAVKVDGYKFILERIPVTQQHKEIASRLVTSLQTHGKVSVDLPSNTVTGTRMNDRRVATTAKVPGSGGGGGGGSQLLSLSLDHSMDSLSLLDESAQRSQFRTQLLRGLNEPTSIPNDAPPSRVLSKGEMRMAAFQRESELLSMSVSLNNPCSSKSRMGSPGEGSMRSRNYSASLLSSSYAKKLAPLNVPPPAFGSAAGGGAPAAATQPEPLLSTFSLTSIASGHFFQSPINNSSAKGTAARERDRDNYPPSRAHTPLLAGSLLEHSTATTFKAMEPLSTVTGGPLSEALWLAPEELGGGAQNVIPAAFTEKSLCFSSIDGNIDGEGMRMLRQVAHQPDKLSVYERSQGRLLLRNTALSTSVEVPSLQSVHQSEVTFGSQKRMYRHANRMLTEKDGTEIACLKRKQRMRHAIVLGRIERNVRRMHTMITVLPPPTHDEVALPPHGGSRVSPLTLPQPAAAGGGGDLQRSLSMSLSQEMVGGGLGLSQQSSTMMSTSSQYRPMSSPSSSFISAGEAAARARPLDKEGISKLIEKVERAVELASANDREVAAAKSRLAGKHKRRKKKGANDDHTSAEPLRDLAEKKLQNAIKSAYREFLLGENNKGGSDGVGGGGGTGGYGLSILNKAAESRANDLKNMAQVGSKTKALTTRALLPFYRIEDVMSLVDLFAKVDDDFSGELDMEEWVKLYSTSRKNVSPSDARTIFLKMDTSGDNIVTVSEMVPVLFNKATKEQLSLITTFTMTYLNKHQERVTKLTHGEVDQLFDAYDVNNISFVAITYLRERIRAMQMPEPVAYHFLSSLVDMEDDEMVNHEEFARIMKPYTISISK